MREAHETVKSLGSHYNIIERTYLLDYTYSNNCKQEHKIDKKFFKVYRNC
jgi:hypothetical protein